MSCRWIIAALSLLSFPGVSFAQDPVVDNFTQGFGNDYQISAGDVDVDGDVDLYIKERPSIVPLDLDGLFFPIVRPPHVVPFVLRQQPNKTFSLVTDLTGLNLAAARPTSSITLRSLDINLDERTDAILAGVGKIISGASDQIVFANPAPGVRKNAPVFVRAIDGTLKSFVEQTSGWFENQNYFVNTAIANGWAKTVFVTDQYVTAWWNTDYIFYFGYSLNGTPLVAATDNVYDPAVAPARCFSGGLSCRYDPDRFQWQMYVRLREQRVEIDYSRFNADALALTNALAPARGNSDLGDDLVAGTPAALSVDTILARVLGQGVLGGVLQSQGRLPNEGGTPADLLGSERLQAIEGLLADLKNAPTAPPPPPPPFAVPVDPIDGVTIKQTRIPQLDQGPMTKVRAIVLHRTSGPSTQSALNQAINSKAHTGTHFYVDKDGTITQTTSLDRRTDHVGAKDNLRSRCKQEPDTCTAAELAKVKNISRNGHSAIASYENTKAYPERYPTSEDSIGIEVVGEYNESTKMFDPPTPAQKAALDKLVPALKKQLQLADKDIYPHGRIANKKDSEGTGLGY